MSLDIKYRPRGYGGVLGQDATKKILQKFVADDHGFQQSYLFAGPYGSGKTTLGRILARALLCGNPQEGNPCDECPSCKELLETNSLETYLEVDAATNSGKEAITRITEALQYDTFSGKQRIHLFDEAHQLSPHALDALLKPMEESRPGLSDKKMVCIFCTTEPEKMRNTILSRCAPAFVIRPLDPESIAKRLQYICDQEKIEYEEEALLLIAEITECHVRDAIKAVEGVRMLGPISKEHVATYLHLDQNALYLDILDKIGTDLPGALAAATDLTQQASPSTCYQRLAEVAMLAYRLGMDAGKPASFWDEDRLRNLGAKGEVLLSYAVQFGSRPGRAAASMLLCDISVLHLTGGAGVSRALPVVVQQVAAGPPITGTYQAPVMDPTPRAPTKDPDNPPTPVVEMKVEADPAQNAEPVGRLQHAPEILGGGTYVNQIAVRKFGAGSTTNASQSSSASAVEAPLFCRLVGYELAELNGGVGGPSG